MARALLKDLHDWKLQDENKDIRGRTLKSADGRDLGTIRNLMVNTDAEQVESVILDNGQEYAVRDLDIRGNDVVLNTAGSATAAPPAGGEGEIRVPVVEEMVRIGKRTVSEGGVRVTTEVKERPVEETVTLRKTDVHVERHKTDRPATEDDLRRAQQSVEAIETVEEPVVEKSARVVEEVVIEKDVQEKEEKVHDTARKTEVHVEDVKPRERGPQKKAS